VRGQRGGRYFDRGDELAVSQRILLIRGVPGHQVELSQWDAAVPVGSEDQHHGIERD
jgi:hypothetical protein